MTPRLETSFLNSGGITVRQFPPGHGRGNRGLRILTHLCNGLKMLAMTALDHGRSKWFLRS